MLDALGHYKLLGPIGAGRMGELFRARDTRAGRTVAIRIVADEIAAVPGRRQPFLDAARAAAALSHPNIAALYEIGEDQGRLFLVSEFVPGDTLRTVIAGRPLNPRHALDHGIQLADALADAHADGICHRDIRPGNIIITPKGIAKFIDLGLAAWTAGGATIEAVEYRSPEQLDIFSLGAVLFEMLTGKPPFGAATASAPGVQQQQQPPPSTINRSLPPELDTIVLKMLAMNLDHRYEAVATVAAELRSVAAILDVREGASDPMPIAASSGRRSRAGLWLTAALLALGLIAGLFLFPW
jgi:serine/threonine-protein kinase